MKSRTWLALISAFLLVGLAGSALLYQRSRGANMDAHARVVATLGELLHEREALGELVLSARFGLLNQYDSLARTSRALGDSALLLRNSMERAVPIDPELQETFEELNRAVAATQTTVEYFKADNAVLRNSVYYLPSVAVGAHDEEKSLDDGGAALQANELSRGLVQAALVYNLVGDKSSEHRVNNAREALRNALDEAGARRSLLLRHTALILDRQPRVDAHVQRILSNELSVRIEAISSAYGGRFGAMVSQANSYRRVLYGWSLALVLALAAIGVQLRRLYTGLEQRVAERTSELASAHAELWGEMKLAKKIQEALVPTAPSLRGCEVAVEMRAAAQVGGDYYDIVVEKDHEWILIGDVSGHGVPAGLIMMMCQTAVRTALFARPDMMPDELLASVNRVLTENIQQLGENKYMTISALRRDQDGTIHLAGAHQDLFIYRAEADRVEVIPTQGMWLGLRSDISRQLQTKRFTLHKGDVLLLYTDGLTEAKKGGRLFDNQGLCEVLSKVSGRDAKGILSDVFGAISEYEVSDDATVLVIRQIDDEQARRVA